MTARVVVPILAAVLLALAVAGLSRAAAPASQPSERARVEAVAATLRCPVCQGLSVADSPSKMAQGMRAIVAEQLADGRSPDQVRDWFVDRYGRWILLSPSPSGLGWLVWLLPVVAVTGGGAAALVVARRRRGPPMTTAEDLATAEKALAAYQSEAPPLTPAGERLESAIALVEAVRSDREVGMASAGSQSLALRRVADAVRALEAEQGAAHAASPDRSASTAASGRATALHRVPRPLRWAGLAGVFLLALTGLLAVNVTPRAEGAPPTGSLPGRQATLAEGRELDRLRGAVAETPADSQARLVLIANLLRAGRVQEARAHIDEALAADAKSLDALLLLGIAQVQEADPGARATLRRFLRLAPPDHPGVAVAEGLLGRDGRR